MSHFSLAGGDGADVCTYTDGARPLVNPLMAIQPDRSGRLELVGIAGDEVATVTLAPSTGMSGEPTMIAIERQRAARPVARR